MGGFLTDQWLDANEPDPKAFDNMSEEKVRHQILASRGRRYGRPGNRCVARLTGRCCAALVVQYYAIIKAWGTWEAFQQVLHELKAIARKHKTTIAHVAMR